ncbi:MAG: nucleotidyl transferase AbiEii/AbiGii toxin family protein [Proteobacteria bacterium]|nr:nucleotidyl transferase AbiEii/AbiGii toxin family protein [Pseudomonadota bacterium]
MTTSNPNGALLDMAPHNNVDKFRAAIDYTAATSGFRRELIEKDYFCSIVLAFIFAEETPLVFKGGTCLNKIHVGFYRLSEDLDFSIAMNIGATRGDRRKAMEPAKRQFSSIQKAVPALKIVSDLAGHNEGRQYTATLAYQSAVAPMPGTIKFEVGLREPLFDEVQRSSSRTLVQDPFKKVDLLAIASVNCLSVREAFSEKIRAALTRKEPAIRDLFDLDYAIRHKTIDLNDSGLLEYARRKIAIPGTNAIDITASRVEAMRLQLKTELQPVLRQDDYDAFDFDQAVVQIVGLANVLK